MKKLWKKNLFSGTYLIALLLAGNTAFAESVQEKLEFSLDPILVTATRYEARDIEIPAATEVFDEEKIEKLGATNVMEVVKNIPGFTLTASPTGNTYIGFRGVSKDNVAILVNGIPLNQDGNYDLETFSTDMVDRIEVVKGGASVLYGSNASAGVINIITKKHSGKNKIILGGGDNHKFKGAVNLVTDKLQINFSRNQSRDRGKVYQSNANKHYLGDKLEKDSLNVQYNLNEHLNFEYMYTSKTSDCSILDGGQLKPGFHSVIKYNLGQVHYNNKDLVATVYYRDRDWKYNTTTHQKGHNYGLDIHNKWNVGKVGLTVGANYENEKTQNNPAIKAGKRDQGAVFFMTETPLSEKTKLFLGAREAYVERSGSTLCPQLQILQQLDKNSNLYVNVNRSMRAPTILEQWETATQLASPDLKAEKGWNYEIGYKANLSNTSLFKVNVFHMDIDDRIYSQSNYNGSGKSMYLNANKYRNTGIEVSYEKSLSNKYNYNLGMSYANPEQQTNGKDWERTDFKFGLNAGIGVTMAKTTANITANYMAVRVNDCKPMLDINMNIKHRLTDRDSLNLNIYNLLDRQDFRTGSSNGISGALLEGRNWLLTYEHTF